MQTLENIFSNLQNIKVIDSAIAYSQYILLDLSVSNPELSKIASENAKVFENYIENYLQKNEAKVAFGGYNEERNLYKRSGIFNDEKNEERNIHIGLDLWIKAGTRVLAALDGTVHSFGFNSGLGNYGPTVILEHIIENQTFYTLYGHLSLESIEQIKIGAVFSKGQPLATLGDATINGDYAPHLHFQIIKNIENHLGDYPGVCSKKDLEYYLENCPDPNLLLKPNNNLNMKNTLIFLSLFLLFGCKSKIIDKKPVEVKIAKVAISEVPENQKNKAYELGKRVLLTCNTSKFKPFNESEATQTVIQNTTEAKLTKTCTKFRQYYGTFKDLQLVEIYKNIDDKTTVFRFKALYSKKVANKELRVTLNEENKASAIKSLDWVGSFH